MTGVQRELDRVLTLLRNKIRERGFTQLEVQEALGWGRSYISQLLTKQKSLRVEQVLLILDVIGVDPAEFFGELYHFPEASFGVGRGESYAEARRGASAGGSGEGLEAADGGDLQTDFLRSFRELRSLLRGLLRLLVDKSVIDVDELASAVKTANGGSLLAELQSE